MSNEMKLLTALCDALGFDVVVDIDYQPRKESQTSAMIHNQSHTKTDRMLKGGQMLDIDEDGMYTSILRIPIVNYRVVPKHD